MKILVTGNEGFVGSHIQASLEAAGHKIIGLEAKGSFREWYDEMRSILDRNIDAIIHVGGIADNQYTDSDIYLWNSYASFLLAKSVRDRSIPFICFSTFLVESTKSDWNARTPYSWSKVVAEDVVTSVLPSAIILRPGIMWGDEKLKNPASYSIPYRLASHTIQHLFRNWVRGYVHVNDVINAVQICLRDQPQGIFCVASEYLSNEELADCINWTGYEWVEDPQSVGMKFVSTHRISDRGSRPMLPGWKPELFLSEELPRLESFLKNKL